MQEVRLSAVSYVVLGFVQWAGEATPYRLKQFVAVSVGNFWTLQHAQLYSEPERLAKAGYLTEERERGGRRRKLYSITDRGRLALADWRGEPTDAIPELRSPALLKLFFGAEPADVAPLQVVRGIVDKKTEEFLDKQFDSIRGRIDRALQRIGGRSNAVYNENNENFRDLVMAKDALVKAEEAPNDDVFEAAAELRALYKALVQLA